MIATCETSRPRSDDVASQGARSEQPTRIGIDPVSFASIKQSSNLLTVANHAKLELQNARSDQVRKYLYAICFRKLFEAAKTQFATEESDAYFELKPNCPELPAFANAVTLRAQHSTMLRSIRELLEEAETMITKHVHRSVDSLGLLGRFWSFQQVLRKHEGVELKLIEDLSVPASSPITTRMNVFARK